MWEIVAYIDGHNRANESGKHVEPMSPEEFEGLLEEHNMTRTIN